MSRRRLHGETQKRRKKKITQALKRQQQVARVSSTHVPAAFERSPEIAMHDIDFLEAMRDMGVRQQPGRPVSPLRQEAAEGIHIRLEQADQDLFHTRMAALGVQPMGHGPRPATAQPQRPHAPPATPAEAAAAEAAAAPAAAGQAGRHGAAGSSATTTTPGPAGPRAGRSGVAAPWHIGAQGDWARVPEDAEETAAAAPQPSPARTPASRPAPAPDGDFTVFEEHTADAELMSATLEDSGNPAQRKYEGAPPAPAPRHSAAEGLPEQPDAELDLHGKSLDQAMHMVQNFLLTAFRQGLRHVLLVTGKGLNSGEGGPVLRNAVVRWLAHDGGLYVKSFNWAPPAHGGGGAVWVVLRDRRQGPGSAAQPD